MRIVIVGYGNAAHPLFNPCIAVSLGFIQGAGALGGKFGVFNFLHPFIAHLGQPAFEGFGLGGGDGLDEAEDAFNRCRLHFSLFAIGGGHVKGGTKCTPVAMECVITRAHFLDILFCVSTICKCLHNILNGKIPLAVVQRAADIGVFKNDDFVGGGHSVISLSVRLFAL
jgi:hypothetical protein